MARKILSGSTRIVVAVRGTRVHRMRQPRYRLAVEERLNHAQVIFLAWFTSTFRSSLHGTEDGQRLTRIAVGEPLMALGPRA